MKAGPGESCAAGARLRFIKIMVPYKNAKGVKHVIPVKQV